MKHTPGPWTQNYICAGSTNEVKADNKRIVLVLQYDHDQNRVADFETCQANAKLIAAAPELLEALNRMLDFYWEGYSDPKKAMEKFAKDNPNSATATSLAAIKKATT